MLDFQRYQLEFTAHIRDPKAHKKPARVVAARMAVYREAVFNNIFESVSICFPVCQKAMGKRAWRALMRDFVKNHPAKTPIFREIPQQFLSYLETVKNSPAYDLPIYLGQLAHYEWVELAVGTLETAQQTETIKLSQKTDLLHEKPVLTPAHMLLEYGFPVHRISASFKPKMAEKTYLLVFRNAEFEVKFIELNSITFQLLNLIKENKMTGKQALKKLAEEITHPEVDTVIQFGAQILTDLARQQAIIGSI